MPRAMTLRSTLGASGTFFTCTLRIASRPMMSGLETTTCRSKRPGRSSARIENVGSVGCGDQNDALIGFKAIHFNEQLVERLLPLVHCRPPRPAPTVATNGINLIDENDARSVLFCLFKHVADAAGTNADKHFNKIRTGNREEGNIGLTCNSSRGQRFYPCREGQREAHRGAFYHRGAETSEGPAESRQSQPDLPWLHQPPATSSKVTPTLSFR